MKSVLSVSRAAFCALALALTGQACSIISSAPYQEVRSYDLGLPVPARAPASLWIDPISSSASCKHKMLYRSDANELFIDEYGKWTQPPGQLLTKYLRLAFRGDASDAPVIGEAKYNLYGSVLAFEADLDAKKVNLCVRYEMIGCAGSGLRLERTTLFSSPLEGDDASAAASAMSKAAALMVQALKDDIAALEAASSKRNPAETAQAPSQEAK